jgi:hypothetical protein
VVSYAVHATALANRPGLDCHPAISHDMSSHMKTTVEISDALLNEARELAVKEQTTLRVLIEEGLRMVTAERRRSKPFKLRDVSFRGKGLQPPLAGASWQQIRDALHGTWFRGRTPKAPAAHYGEGPLSRPRPSITLSLEREEHWGACAPGIL